VAALVAAIRLPCDRCVDQISGFYVTALMPYPAGRLVKRMSLPDGLGCVDVIARQDGTFQFFHMVPCIGDPTATRFESGVYISPETAEAAARLKFKL
jgi:hypothetical protein